MKILFLDIDGVLHSASADSGTIFDPDCMRQLKRVWDDWTTLREYSGYSAMVSSSSRALAPGFFVGSDAPSWATTEEDARTESDGDGRWMTGRADQRASAGGDHLAAQCCTAAHALILARFMPLRVLRVESGAPPQPA